MKMEYEIRRRITKMRESEAFLYILGCLCVCVRAISRLQRSLFVFRYTVTLSLYLLTLSEEQLTTVYLVMLCQRDKKEDY